MASVVTGVRGWSFYAGMSLLVIAVILAGFGPSYAHSRSELPFWVHLHGLVMASWITLFAIQAALVRSRAWRLHRRLGFASVGLVVAMLPLGIATDLLAIRRGATPPFFTPVEMLAADTTDLLLFAGLFAAAVALRRRGDWHKRLLLTATVLLTWPALGRLAAFQGVGFDAVVPVSTAMLLLLALAGPAHDWLTQRRIHPAYLWAVGTLVMAQPVHWLVASLGPVQALSDGMDSAGRRAA